MIILLISIILANIILLSNYDVETTDTIYIDKFPISLETGRSPQNNSDCYLTFKFQLTIDQSISIKNTAIIPTEESYIFCKSSNSFEYFRSLISRPNFQECTVHLSLNNIFSNLDIIIKNTNLTLNDQNIKTIITSQMLYRNFFPVFFKTNLTLFNNYKKLSCMLKTNLLPIIANTNYNGNVNVYNFVNYEKEEGYSNNGLQKIFKQKFENFKCLDPTDNNKRDIEEILFNILNFELNIKTQDKDTNGLEEKVKEIMFKSFFDHFNINFIYSIIYCTDNKEKNNFQIIVTFSKSKENSEKINISFSNTEEEISKIFKDKGIIHIENIKSEFEIIVKEIDKTNKEFEKYALNISNSILFVENKNLIKSISVPVKEISMDNAKFDKIHKSVVYVKKYSEYIYNSVVLPELKKYKLSYTPEDTIENIHSIKLIFYIKDSPTTIKEFEIWRNEDNSNYPLIIKNNNLYFEQFFNEEKIIGIINEEFLNNIDKFKVLHSPIFSCSIDFISESKSKGFLSSKESLVEKIFAPTLSMLGVSNYIRSTLM